MESEQCILNGVYSLAYAYTMEGDSTNQPDGEKKGAKQSHDRTLDKTDSRYYKHRKPSSDAIFNAARTPGSSLEDLEQIVEPKSDDSVPSDEEMRDMMGGKK